MLPAPPSHQRGPVFTVTPPFLSPGEWERAGSQDGAPACALTLRLCGKKSDHEMA